MTDGFLPDRSAHDDDLLLGVVLAVVVAPFRRPETVDADGDQSVDRCQRRSVVDDDPQTTQGKPATDHTGRARTASSRPEYSRCRTASSEWKHSPCIETICGGKRHGNENMY